MNALESGLGSIVCPDSGGGGGVNVWSSMTVVDVDITCADIEVANNVVAGSQSFGGGLCIFVDGASGVSWATMSAARILATNNSGAGESNAELPADGSSTACTYRANLKTLQSAPCLSFADMGGGIYAGVLAEDSGDADNCMVTVTNVTAIGNTASGARLPQTCPLSPYTRSKPLPPA